MERWDWCLLCWSVSLPQGLRQVASVAKLIVDGGEWGSWRRAAAAADAGRLKIEIEVVLAALCFMKAASGKRLKIAALNGCAGRTTSGNAERLYRHTEMELELEL
jgi:hypothetical protein